MPTSTLFDLHNKVIVITGGTGILGFEMAQTLGAAGAKIVLVSRRTTEVAHCAQRLQSAGVIALGIAADVLDHQALQNLCNQVLSSFGQVDVLINAAGGNLPGATVDPDAHFFDLDPQALDQVIRLNLMGTLLPSQVFGAVFAHQGFGNILNISSASASRPLSRVVGYSLSKAGIDNFTQWLAVEMADKYGERIRVNALAPGFFISDQNRSLLTQPDGSLTERGHSIIAHTPMKRFGQPRDLMGALLFLCSDASAFVTGTVLHVDGGFGAKSI